MNNTTTTNPETTIANLQRASASRNGSRAARTDYEDGVIAWNLDNVDGRDRALGEVFWESFVSAYRSEAARILRAINS